MIDLHTHTSYSDGTWNVKQLLKKAEEAKIEVLSITDHDNVNAYLELRKLDYHELFHGKIINGVELNTIFNGSRIELLAYDFDIDKINIWCRQNYKKKMSEKDLNKQFESMVSSAKKNNIIIDKVDYSKSKGWPVEIIYHEIKKHPENKSKFDIKAWNDINYFMNCFVSDVSFPVYVNLTGFFPDIKKTVKAIKQAGGKVFLAHVYKYPIKDIDKFLNTLIENKLIDGLEVYHSSFTHKQAKYLYNYCIDNNLLICGGSDCHGDKEKSSKIGIGYNNLNINKEYIENWFKYEEEID